MGMSKRVYARLEEAVFAGRTHTTVLELHSVASKTQVNGNWDSMLAITCACKSKPQ